MTGHITKQFRKSESRCGSAKKKRDAENLEEIKRKPYRRVSNIAAIRFLSHFLNLFVPSLKKPDVDGNISCNFTFAFSRDLPHPIPAENQVLLPSVPERSSHRRSEWHLPAPRRGYPLLHSSRRDLENNLRRFPVRFYENGWISKFHSVSSFFLFFFTEIHFLS